MMDTNTSAPQYPPRVHSHAGQQGLILGIALLFLALAAVLGVSALQVSALEQILAANTQQSYHLFQAVESGIDAALRFALQNRTRLPNVGAIQRDYTFDGIPVDTLTTYRGAARTLPYGYSLRGGFQVHHFSIRSHARTTVGAHAAHERGLAVIGPRGP